jgi:hypothetical protein
VAGLFAKLRHRAGCEHLIVDSVETVGQATIGEGEAGSVIDDLAALGDVPALASLGPHRVAQCVLHLGVEAVLNIGLHVE